MVLKLQKKLWLVWGRAGTVGERSLGYPDAGAYALGVIFSEIYKNMKFHVNKVIE